MSIAQQQTVLRLSIRAGRLSVWVGQVKVCLRTDSLPAAFDARVVFRGSTSVGIDEASTFELETTPTHHLSLSARLSVGVGHLPSDGRSPLGNFSKMANLLIFDICLLLVSSSTFAETKAFSIETSRQTAAFQGCPPNFGHCFKETMLLRCCSSFSIVFQSPFCYSLIQVLSRAESCFLQGSLYVKVPQTIQAGYRVTKGTSCRLMSPVAL